MAKASTTPTANAAASASAQAQAARHALHVQRKAEAVQMQAAGLSPKDIAVRLGISLTTVLRMIAPATAAPTVAAPSSPALSAPPPVTITPIKRKRVLAVNAPTHPRMVLAKDRRERCLKMRIAGLSEREIARRLGVSNTQITRMLRTSLDDLNKSEMNSAAHLRRLDLERCDEMITGLMPHRRDPRYVDSLLRILERRASYLGIDAPTKAEIVSKNIVEEDFPDLDALPDEDLDTIERLLDKARALKAAKMQGEHDAKT